jgi:hypothetical protein
MLNEWYEIDGCGVYVWVCLAFSWVIPHLSATGVLASLFYDILLSTCDA